METIKNTIELLDAQSEFVGPVSVGEHVAQWLSVDKAESLSLSTYSHDDADECLQKARDTADDLGLQTGFIEIMRIVPSAD